MRQIIFRARKEDLEKPSFIRDDLVEPAYSSVTLSVFKYDVVLKSKSLVTKKALLVSSNEFDYIEDSTVGSIDGCSGFLKFPIALLQRKKTNLLLADL